MKQSFFLAVGTVIAIALVVIIFVMPLYDDVKSAKGYIEEKERIVSELETLITKTDEWRILLAKEKDVIGRVDLSLPRDKDMPNLIVILENLSSASGINLDAVAFQNQESKRRRSLPNSETEQKKINSVDLSMELIGSYPAFKSFLNKLENNIRSFDIKSIEFSESETQADFGNFMFKVQGLVYYQ